ncbi:hypothetical protein MVEG_08139 [Podila verticillata NRRL 6337]|nr:hypothetical protein MVEG_08139 [Podila verticillata NRRL 6337]
MDFTDRVAIAGEQESIITRPNLYAILLRQIPKGNIHMNKKVLSFVQGENGVMIRCSDDSTYDGNILVGADGAHSAVRQHLYAALKKDKRLPASDDVPLPYTYVCLVGQTEPLDPEEFPDLQLPLSQFKAVLENNNTYSWTTFTTASHTVCYNVVQLLNKETSKQNDSFRCSEWGSEAAEVMNKEVRHFRLPWGGKDGKELTMGDLIDRTPKGTVTKVMLEEKVFDCWYDRRTVLLGDARDKLSPAGGAGAITAMHDAIAQANWICAIPSREMSDIEQFFKEYRTEQFLIAKKTFETSRMFNNIGGRVRAAECMEFS